MSLSRLLPLLLCLVSVNLFAYQRPYVTALSAGFSDDNQQFYGISSYETLGKGRWGIYGEMLFAYQSDTLHECASGCEYVDLKERQFNFTVGGSYGLSDNLYGLLGVGVRVKKIDSVAYNQESLCDNPTHLPATNNNNYEQYCQERRVVDPAAQVGLLYVTPWGVSVAGTIDTQKTAIFSVGYQF